MSVLFFLTKENKAFNMYSSLSNISCIRIKVVFN